MFHLDTRTLKTVSTRPTRVALTGLALAMIACGSSADTAELTRASATIDSRPLEPVARALPSVQSGGGGVLVQPRVVPVYFGTDEHEADLGAFLAQLGGSEYWKSTTAEYGVGALVVGDAVHLAPDLPPSITDAELRTWLEESIAAAPSDFPAFDEQTIHLLFLPQYVVVRTAAGRTCNEFDSYHGEITVDSKVGAFAVVANCGFGPNDLAAFTRRTSSALVQVVTNPLPESNPAFAVADARGVGWALGLGGEVTDRCSMDGTSLLGGFTVARSWSNIAALAGHDPCVPAPTTAYFNVEPILPDTVPYAPSGTGKLVEAAAVRVGLGETRTVPVEAFADTALPWTMDAVDVRELHGLSPELSFSFDDSLTGPGRVRHLTITRVAEGATDATPFVIRSRAQGVTHTWWGVATK